MTRKNVIYAALSVFMLLNFSGCTLIGLIGGSISDVHRAVVESPAWENLEKIEPGTPLKVQLRDQQTITGTFQELASVDSADYSRRYETFRAGGKYNELFPALYDTIRFSRKFGLFILPPDWKYLFLGFDFNSIRLLVPPNNQIKVRKLDSLVTIIDQQGKKMNAQTIKVYVDGGMVPLRSELVLRASDGMQRIGGEKIIKINLPQKATGTIVYGLLGLGVDFLIYRMIIVSMQNWHPLGNSKF